MAEAFERDSVHSAQPIETPLFALQEMTCPMVRCGSNGTAEVQMIQD